jgi:ribosome-interacting GTPase 1
MKKLMMLATLLAMLAIAAVPAMAQVTQESEQEAESGDLDQSFEVSSSGDNSNQCVGIQGVGNTGNAQNLTDVIQYGSTADDFEFEDVGSTITVSPESSTTCDQQVNQAASASG